MKRHEEWMKQQAMQQSDVIDQAMQQSDVIDMVNEIQDMVNNPPHYTHGDIECIDAIRAALGPEGFKAFCRGNVIKYSWRCDHKNGVQDIEKARWYLTKVIEEEQRKTEK